MNPKAGVALELLAGLSPKDWAELLVQLDIGSVPEVAEPAPTTVRRRRKVRRGWHRVDSHIERAYTKEALSIAEVAKRFDKSRAEVIAILAQRGVKLRRRPNGKRKAVRKPVARKRGRTGAKRKAHTGGRLIQVGESPRLLDLHAAIDLYKQNPKLTVKELAKISDFSQWKLLRELRNAGVIRKRGGSRQPAVQ